MSKKDVKYYLESITHGFKNTEQREMNSNGVVYEFSLDYRLIDKNNIENIHAYLMNKHMTLLIRDNKFPTDVKKLFH